MIITAIEPCRKSLSAIYIDGELAVKLDTEAVLQENLKIGAEITDDELYELVKKSNFKRAKNKAIWYISFRDYTKKEMFDKLSKETDEEAAEEAVEKLEELGLIDDERFAERYAADLFNIKKMSESGVKYKLIQKGIDRETAEEVAMRLAPDGCEQILALLERKYYRNMFDEKGRKRTIAALQRLGYKWGEIKEAFDVFDEENEEM